MTPPQGKLRVLFADDESIARRRMRRLLTAMADVEVVAECSDGQEVLALLRDQPQQVDVALLDIQMPGLSGLDATGLMGDDGPVVIFTTAHAEHAVEAFDVGAADYVLKPIDAARLARALDRARGRLPAANAVDALALPVRGEVRLVAPDEISHALFDGQLVTVYLATGESILTEHSLQELQRRLPADLFERVHRRALLNLSQVERLQPLDSGGYLAWTTGGESVPISRQAARDLRRRLKL